MQSRISVSEKPGSTSILVFPFRDQKKEFWLTFWVIAWLTGGLIIIYYFFTADLPRNERLMLLVWMAFWLYFLRLSAHPLLWRKKGFERILIKDNKLFYRKELLGFGKSRVFDTEAISSLRTASQEESPFLQQFLSSYWFLGGETIAFDYYNKEVRLGQQLELNEQSRLMQLLRSKIKDQ